MQGIEEFFKAFDWSRLAVVALFALPGFISLRVWSLIFPTSEQALKDQLGEAIGFGILNAMICAPLFFLLEPTKPLALYGLAVLTLVVLPAVWPFPIRWLLRTGTRPNMAHDHGIRGGTRPVATQPPTKPPGGGSAVQNPKPSATPNSAKRKGKF